MDVVVFQIKQSILSHATRLMNLFNNSPRAGALERGDLFMNFFIFDRSASTRNNESDSSFPVLVTNSPPDLIRPGKRKRPVYPFSPPYNTYLRISMRDHGRQDDGHVLGQVEAF